MAKITYPRSCSQCGKQLGSRASYCRHKAHCAKKTDPVPCLHCESTFTRKDDMLRHVKKFHSEGAKRKAEANEELARMELLHADKVPRLSVEDSQTGGAVSTRSMKKDSVRVKEDQSPVKKEERRTVKGKLEDDDVDMSYMPDDGLDDFLIERVDRLQLEHKPLLKANLTFLPYQRQGLKGAVKKGQFSVTFDQQRKATTEENLGEGMSESLFQVLRDTILEEKLSDSTKVHLTLTSKEHLHGTLNSGLLSDVKYGIPIQEFINRSEYVHAMFGSLVQKMNSALKT